MWFTDRSYRFLVTANDAARLWVDERLAIDEWNIGPETTTGSAVIEFAEGGHDLRLHYLQGNGRGVLWVRAEPMGHGRRGGLP